MIKIFVADDHAMIRRGIKQTVADEVDMQVVGEAQSAKQTIDLLRISECDVVILDVSMPDGNGLHVLKEIKKERPTLSVLMLSMHPEEQFAVRALRAGASGYLTKESSPEELLTALRKVSTGGRYLTLSLAERLAEDLVTASPVNSHERLSDREYEVFSLLASGRTVSEIAEQLSLSVKTVSTYRARILEKMNLRNNAEIMRYAMQRQLVD
ncbi:MAG: response regulator transcription factor [Deltaproteobacteria bacterium]|nr:response regulator transcription factor [Deltaproteobacteria bacterium]